MSKEEDMTVNTSKPGTRVRLVRCTDTWTTIKPGTLGTIEFIDDTGTVHVKWDNGSRLGLIPGEDVWEEVP